MPTLTVQKMFISINPPQHKLKCKILPLQHISIRSALQSVKTSIKHWLLTQVILGSNTTDKYRSYTFKYKSHKQLGRWCEPSN